MKKILIILQVSFITLTLLFVPLTINSVSKEVKNPRLNINHLAMEVITTKVELDVDKYQNILINDEPNSFKSSLINVMTKFASEYQISLDYGVDYYFKLKGIDPYETIKKFEVITVNVNAGISSKKIIGSFDTQVKLVRKAKSINHLVIKKQVFDQVILNQTTFFQALQSCIKIISQTIKSEVQDAEFLVHYAVNIEGYEQSAKINKNDLGIKDVNVNAITNEQNHLLEGSFSFQLAISLAEVVN
ncbi:MAG: hypothetical protein REH79_01825 [Spiroplasma sp.]|nr:hypothetical protein [Spiroplasma sp.]